jgi:hypothetical protein
MFVAAAGRVILMVCTLAASAVAACICFPYAAYSFLVIVEQTAGGCDDVRWPGDSAADWFGKFFFLGWLVIIAFLPVWGLGWLLAPNLMSASLVSLGILAGVVWLVFPVYLLSSMSAFSPWQILHWGFLRRLARHPLALAVFYVETAFLFLLAAGLLYASLFLNWWLLFIGIPAGAAVLFMYARLVGRLGWLVGYHTPTIIDREPLKKKKRKTAATRTDVRTPEVKTSNTLPEIAPTVTEDLWAVPTDVVSETTTVPSGPIEEEDEWDSDKKPYGLLSDDASRRQWHGRQEEPKPGPQEAQLDDAERAARMNPFDLLSDEAMAASLFEANRPRATRDVYENTYEMKSEHTCAGPPPSIEELYSEAQIKKMERTFVQPKKEEDTLSPHRAFWTGVWNFPAYDSTLKPLVNMSLSGLLFCVLLRLVIVQVQAIVGS